MNIAQAKEEIKRSIAAYLMKDDNGQYKIPVQAQRPILMIGPPGIGKTAVMEQVAAECGIGLVAYTITHHTRQSAIGLPMIEKKEYGGKTYSATEYTMSEIVGSVYDEMKRSGKTEGILFLDEINCVSETLAPTMLQFLQKKMFGSHSIPDGWIIVAAGNPPEYNKSVRPFDIVTLDRVRKIEITQDFGVWKRYAYQRGVHPSVITYLEIKKENFYSIETTATGQRFVTARGWEDLSYMIYADELLNIPVTEEMVGQYIQHPKLAKDFANYYDLYNQYRDDYHVDEILAGQIRENTVKRLKAARFDEKLSLIGLLLGRLNESFKESHETDIFVEKLYDFLVSAKDLCAGEVQACGVLADFFEKSICNLDGKADARLVKTLERYARTAAAGGDFSAIKEQFAKETQNRSQSLEKTEALLRAAFDFMEKVFGESQEMVIFVTELNMNSHAMWFIRENGSEAYYKYNQGLLFGSGHSNLLREIEEVSPYMDFVGI